MPDYIDDGGDEGAIFGRHGGKIALFGGTPMEQPVLSALSTSSATLAYLRARIGRLESVLYSLGIVVFDGMSGPAVPDTPPPEDVFGVLYGEGFVGYYGDDEATYQDAEPAPGEDDVSSLYGEFFVRYGDDHAVY